MFDPLLLTPRLGEHSSTLLPVPLSTPLTIGRGSFFSPGKILATTPPSSNKPKVLPTTPNRVPKM